MNSLSTESSVKLEKYDFFKKIGSPKYVVAPMVDQSELPYRMLTRKYGAQLCYTPMLHSRMFSESEGYRKEFFCPHPEDRPLVVQFCGNDPQVLLRAAKYVENDCDAVDINLGCPQGIAKKGKYGSFLLEKTQLICDMVKILHENLKVPVTCKIRCLPSEEQTIKLAKAIEASGCSLLTVHGRAKEHKKQDVGPANWYMIKKVKESVSIPVIANGGMAAFEDIQKCLEYTGCDGVMSSEAILEYPALFDNSQIYNLDELALEYLQMVVKYPGEADIKNIRSHMHKFLHMGLKIHTDIREKIANSKSVDELVLLVQELNQRREGTPNIYKIGWYYRYFPSMNLKIEGTPLHTTRIWDEQIENDPLFNKKLKDQQKKKAEETVNDNVLGSGQIEMDLGDFLTVKEDEVADDQVENKD